MAKPDAIWIDCPGITNDGRMGHTMRDYCWTCAPYWERVPTCPRDGAKLQQSGYCRKCKKFASINWEERR